MLVIMMWLIVRLLCELCIVKRCCFFVVIIIDDNYDDDYSLDYNLIDYIDVNVW